MTTTNSDCGCHDSGAAVRTAPASSAPRRTVFVPRDAAAPVLPSAASSASTTTDTVDLGGFRGLNPQDGLFLRGEHLAAIQEYSRALTTAVATASGTGIVHGLGVALIGDSLEISPGLAISPRGRLLLLSRAVTITLDDAHLPARPVDGFWRIELHWASDTSGPAPVYGSLCADDCADAGATVRQWRDEGVEIRIVPDVLPGFEAVGPSLRGNWLSSAYFERERSNGRPWLVPAGPDLAVPRLASQDWGDGTAVPDERGVPLGIVYGLDQSTGGYRLQMWTARRLVDGPVAHATWQGRLAMRPWSIFLAQILQFQAEMIVAVAAPTSDRAVLLDPGTSLFDQEATAKLRAAVADLRKRVGDRDPLRTQGRFLDLLRAADEIEEDPRAQSTPVPVSAQFGIRELPPAGYLAIPERDADSAAGAFFGSQTRLRFRHMRADQIAEEVLAAQHRDRIPLDGRSRILPALDILVPSEPADRSSLMTDSYGWVAFVRRGPEPVPPSAPEAVTEDVEVYVRGLDGLDVGSDLDLDGQLDELVDGLDEGMGPLTFPRGAWAYQPSEAGENTCTFLGKVHEDQGLDPMGVVALTRGDDRMLAALRAGLFTISLDTAYKHLPIRAYNNARLDAIIVLVTRSPEE